MTISLKRFVEAHDLELFAINTGSFYQRHKQLAAMPLTAWSVHVRDVVLVRYCREVEPVKASSETVVTVAKALQEYYQRHIKEL